MRCLAASIEESPPAEQKGLWGVSQRYEIILGDCLSVLRGMPDKSVDLVLGSPPYAGKGERYEGGRKSWPMRDWVLWMHDVGLEACRVSKGWFGIVADGYVKDGAYQPVMELLVAELFNSDQAHFALERTLIWSKNSPPNRSGKWWSHCYEPVLFVRDASKNPRAFNPEPLRTPLKYKTGGHFRQRNSKGERTRGSDYPTKPALPKDVLYTPIGGGLMGSPLAHDNEAPYPESLVEPILLGLTAEGDTVLDPWSGSGTTLAVALKLNRSAIGIDIRESQVELTKRRLSEVQLAFA